MLCVADNEQDALIQLAAVLRWVVKYCGRTAPCSAIWRRNCRGRSASAFALPKRSSCWPGLRRGYLPRRFRPAARAVRAGGGARRAIVSVQGFARGETNLLLERLYIERSLSVNTAAAGGNASLMTIG